ncbi:hypothetical protein TRVL_04148 [Trypanosoma vivax]|nr:hypothetical protein TRVL_04148 [Trypanosoma vivax]
MMSRSCVTFAHITRNSASLHPAAARAGLERKNTNVSASKEKMLLFISKAPPSYAPFFQRTQPERVTSAHSCNVSAFPLFWLSCSSTIPLPSPRVPWHLHCVLHVVSPADPVQALLLRTAVPALLFPLPLYCPFCFWPTKGRVTRASCCLSAFPWGNKLPAPLSLARRLRICLSPQPSLARSLHNRCLHSAAGTHQNLMRLLPCRLWAFRYKDGSVVAHAPRPCSLSRSTTSHFPAPPPCSGRSWTFCPSSIVRTCFPCPAFACECDAPVCLFCIAAP